MGRFTRIQREILLAVGSQGKCQSLFALANELEINYSHAHDMVNRLQAAGVLRVEKPGRDLVLSLPGDETIP